MAQLFAAFGIKGSLLLAQAINFGLLLVVLSYFLYKPVMKVLDERRAKVAQGVLDAERAREKLSTADAEALSTVKSAETEAAGIVEQARGAANDQKTKIVKDAEARAAQIASDADARAKEASAKMLRESEQEIARLIVLGAAQVLKEKA
jgi:F-type H+-transporting ATPase subunit b